MAGHHVRVHACIAKLLLVVLVVVVEILLVLQLVAAVAVSGTLCKVAEVEISSGVAGVPCKCLALGVIKGLGHDDVRHGLLGTAKLVVLYGRSCIPTPERVEASIAAIHTTIATPVCIAASAAVAVCEDAAAAATAAGGWHGEKLHAGVVFAGVGRQRARTHLACHGKR